MRRFFAVTTLALGIAYAGVLGLLYVKQRDLLYPRNPARAEIAAANLPGVEEVLLPSGHAPLVELVERPDAHTEQGRAPHPARPTRAGGPAEQRA